MPVSRMRMRPWLENRLDSQSIAGLVWLDKDKKIFSIPWKHAARHGWELEKDACLFKQWAIHTGKYKVGMSDPDPKTWKANFRCAMNSLPDIVEVKDKSVNKGCGAVRVYRMLQDSSKKKDKRSRTKTAKPNTKGKRAASNEVSDEQDTSLSQDSMQTEESIQEPGSTEQFFSQDFSRSQCSTDEESSELSSPVLTPDSTGLYMPFQVSPLHSPDFGDKMEDIETSNEQDLSNLQDFLNGFWLQSNVVDTTEPSPDDFLCGMPGQEIEVRFYTELRASLPESEENAAFYDWTMSGVLQQTT